MDTELLQRAFNLIETNLRKGQDVYTGMYELTELYASEYKNYNWEALSSIRYDTDIDYLRSWLENLLTRYPPASPIKGYWFGLFEKRLPNGVDTCLLYVSGATRFEPEPDWAVWRNDSYLPEGRYAKSEALADIYRCLANIADDTSKYSIPVGYASLAIRSVVDMLDPSLILGDRTARGVAVGWDEGDYVVLGQYTHQGWQR